MSQNHDLWEPRNLQAVIGIGLDLVELDRFRLALDRTPGLVERCFTQGERVYAQMKADPTERFAVRFAAKEAVMKAMGVGLGEVRLCDIEVERAESGRPSIILHGTAADKAKELGIVEWKVSLTHTGRSAEAMVVALGHGRPSDEVAQSSGFDS